MICDLCGKSGTMYKAEIEGSRMNVCEGCARYGKVFHEIKQVQSKKETKEAKDKLSSGPAKTPETVQLIAKDYALRIKNARERKGIKQEDFAKLVNIKDSLLLHLESGKMEPNMELAKKLEKALGIKLVEEIVLEPEVQKSNMKQNGPMTLGDLINIKKRK